MNELGYRMPAEWEPHEATWLSWPHNPETWPGKMEPIPFVWAKMIEVLHHCEKIHLNVNNKQMEDEVKTFLTQEKINLNQIIFHHIPTDDCWMRDCGPIFVVRENEGKKELALTKWIFNKWGGKYPPWDLDNEVPYQINKKLSLPFFETGIVLEGGSIDVNGMGLLLTTESCLLNKNRNPQLSQKEIEQSLKDYLGVTHILWLGEEIVGDDTDGHIDDLARFINKNTIVTVVEEDPADENYKILRDNLKRLQLMKDEQGRPLNIVTLPMPGPVVYEDQRLPASYANFYIANKVVLAPTYRHHNDERALQILKECFPTRKIVGLDATDLVWGLGAFHCVTQQQPKI